MYVKALVFRHPPREDQSKPYCSSFSTRFLHAVLYCASFLLIVDVCKCDVKKKIKGSPTPTMIIQTVLAMSVSIFQHYCAQSLPSGFRHFQPEPGEDSRPPARMIHGHPAEDSRCIAQLSTGVCTEQPQNSSEKVFHVMYCTRQCNQIVFENMATTRNKQHA